jgi:hypothetical protein
MIERIQIELQVDSDARSRSCTPYLEREDFIKYCKANGVYTNAEALEAYEKKRLLYPCFRLLYPSELLRRKFRAILPDGNGQYRYRDEWEPLINLEEALSLSQMWHTKESEKAMLEGHPLDQALEAGVPFIVNPSEQKYKAWSRYNVVEGTYEGIRSKKSRAVHYYSTWKLFFLDELNSSNTVSHNRATDRKSHWWLKQDELHACSLNEFMPYFRNVASFTYRYNLRQINYIKNSRQTKAEWDQVVDKSQRLAQGIFKDANYKKWIRFLRKLIELHEDYRKYVRLIIAEEAKRYIVRTVRLIRFATGYDFKRICDDVCGPLINRFDGVGHEDGVYIYPRMLEEILANEEWDLKQNVKRHFELDLKDFNKSLIEKEKIPEPLCEELFDELIKEPEGAALAAIRKINKALNITKLYRNTEMWGGISDLAKSVEVYGRKWHGGKYMENILDNFFSLSSLKYSAWRTQLTGKDSKCTDANGSDAFLSKLAFLLSAKHVPADRRFGRHLLIAHLTRNFTSHHKGLTGKVLRENLGHIYSALINTLFVLYAAYKKQ